MSWIILIISAVCGIGIVNLLYKLRMKITGTDVMLVNMKVKIFLYLVAFIFIYGCLTGAF